MSINRQAYALWSAVEAKCSEFAPIVEMSTAAMEGEYQLLLNDPCGQTMNEESVARLLELSRELGRLDGITSVISGISDILLQHDCRSSDSDQK